MAHMLPRSAGQPLASPCAKSRLRARSCPMDEVDTRILAALQRDGRIANQTLADEVHLSPSPCLRRVRRLEESGVVAGYRAVLDRRAVGLELTVFVEVKVASQTRESATAS